MGKADSLGIVVQGDSLPRSVASLRGKTVAYTQLTCLPIEATRTITDTQVWPRVG